MWEEGGDEKWREGECAISKRRDLKVIKQFKTSVFVVTAVFFFLTDVQGNIYRLRNSLVI